MERRMLFVKIQVLFLCLPITHKFTKELPRNYQGTNHLLPNAKNVLFLRITHKDPQAGMPAGQVSCFFLLKSDTDFAGEGVPFGG